MRLGTVGLIWGLACLTVWIPAHAQAAKKGSATRASLRPSLRAIVPNVLPAGQAPACVVLKGQRLRNLGEVSVRDCSGQMLTVGVTKAAEPFVDLPAASIGRPGILHVGSAEGGFLILAIADPALFKMSDPAPDPSNDYDWSGRFNMVVDDVQVPENASIVAISWVGKERRKIILGKEDKAIKQLEQVPAKPIGPGPVTAEYFLLPCVDVSDVRWGAKDVEAFWIGTLSTDGTRIVDRQYLSEMVQEPSGELDK
jgi:hypothetical protein